MKAKNDSAKNEASGKRILLLGGAGKYGSISARNLATFDLVSRIGIAGRNQDALNRVAADIGNKARAVQMDILDERHLVSVAEEYDIVVNMAGPEYEVLLPALRGAIAAGQHYCDIGADGATAEKQLELDALAKERDVVAIPGMLVTALANLLALHAYQQFDRTEEIQVCLNTNRYFLGQVNYLQQSGRIDTSLQGILNMLSRPTRVYRNGRWADIDARENGISIVSPMGGIANAYPVSYSWTITLARYLPGIRNVSSVLGVPNPQLGDLMFSIARQISSGELTDKAAAQLFLETIGKDPDHWMEASPGPLSTARAELWVVVTGWKEGRRGRYRYWPTTFGNTLVVAVLCILRGEVSVRGVLPPEACFEPLPFFEEMVSLMPDPPPGGKLFDESFEWVE